MADILILRMKG